MRPTIKDSAKVAVRVAEAAGRAAHQASQQATDGRAARWEDHRAQRREELVLAAVSAIDELGPEASVAEIARHAEVSKPVLYRYFDDKDDLHHAVGMWAAQAVLDAVIPVVLEGGPSAGPSRERVAAATRAYLSLIERHPHVVGLLVQHRGNRDPLADGKELIAATLARILGDTLRALRLDSAGAEPWAHALVGIGLSTGTWWLDRRTLSREAMADYVTAFVWHAFEGIAAEHGVALDETGHLSAVRS